MKKTSGKPIVSFESFTFSSNIAGGCEFMDNGYAVFYSGNGECIQNPQEDNLGNLCYHVSTDATRMFMS